MKVIRASSLVEQVEEVLELRIRNGDYELGNRLPSESDLSAEFDVSRATIRTVLARLSANGLILRKHGDGTYVNEAVLHSATHTGGLWDYVKLIENNGSQAEIKGLDIHRRAPEPKEMDALKVETTATIVEMTRLFYADSQPVILAKNSFPEKLLVDTDTILDGNMHIKEFIKTYFMSKIAYAITHVSSENAGKTSAQYLEVQENRPLLKLNIVFYDRDNQPILCGESLINDSMLDLKIVQTW